MTQKKYCKFKYWRWHSHQWLGLKEAKLGGSNDTLSPPLSITATLTWVSLYGRRQRVLSTECALQAGRLKTKKILSSYALEEKHEKRQLVRNSCLYVNLTWKVNKKGYTVVSDKETQRSIVSFSNVLLNFSCGGWQWFILIWVSCLKWTARCLNSIVIHNHSLTLTTSHY